MAEFFIQDDRKGILIAIFARKYGADSAEFFINACEREIAAWLKRWPPLRTAADDAPAQLEKVRRLAVDLHAALMGLDERAEWILGSHIIGQCKGAGSRHDWPTVQMMLREVMYFVNQVAEDAGACHQRIDAPITRRADQDLCDQFTRLHYQAFGDLPSSTPGSLFPAFCEEIAGDVAAHSDAPPVKITRTIIVRSLERGRASPLE